MCCITKAPKQKKSNEALYGESYICPASLSWVNTEFGEWQPTPLLSLTPYVASALLKAGWKMRPRVPLPMHTCKAQKSSHIYCTNVPPHHSNFHTTLSQLEPQILTIFPLETAVTGQSFVSKPHGKTWSAGMYCKNGAKIHCISVRGKWILAGLHNHWGCELTVCLLKGLWEKNKR